MFCPKCGYQNADNVRFCIRCGAGFPAAPTPDSVHSASNDPPEGNVPPSGSVPPPAPSGQAAYAPPPPVNVTPEMMASQWYYQLPQQAYGPVPANTMLQMLRDNYINANTPVKMVSAPGQPEFPWLPLYRTFLYDIFSAGMHKPDGTGFVGGVNNFINNITGDSGKLNVSFSQLFSDVFKKHTSEEADKLFISGTSLTTPPESDLTSGWPKPWLFSRIFLILAGSFAILWGCCEIFGVQSAHNVIPGMVFMGALAVPFSVIVFFMEINVPRNISFLEILKIFFLGGALSLLLTFFISQFITVQQLDFIGAILVGITEEVAKLLAVLLFVRKAKTKYMLNGLLIGSAIGAGFAVFETAGYAWFQSQYFSGILDILFLRGFLSVGGHVAWAAISGAAIVMVKKDAPLASQHVFSGQFLKLFAVPVVLHSIWDMPITLGAQIHLVPILLTVIVWIFIVKIINSGLRQIESAKAN